MSVEKVTIKQAIVIGEALYHLGMGSTRRNALLALVELTDMVKSLQKEVRRLDQRNALADQIASGD